MPTIHELFLIDDALVMTCRNCGDRAVLEAPTKLRIDHHARTHRCQQRPRAA